MSASPIPRFEDFIAWQRARALTKKIYRASGSGTFARDYALRNQIRRAAVSIMANIAEGFERGRPAEFHQFLSIAKGSAAEVRAQLYVALDAGHIDEEKFVELRECAEEVGKLLVVFVTRLSDGGTASSRDRLSLITHDS